MKKETEKLIEKIKGELKEILSERRYNHSVSVMNKCIELAEIYNVDVDEAALAGLTHDIAKEIPYEESLKIAENNNIYLDDIEKKYTYLVHGKIGAHIVKEKYGFNERIQNAIKFHTTTSPDMDNLAKILFVADKTEDIRKDDLIDVDEQRRVAKENLDDAMILIINNTIKKLIFDGSLIHPGEVYTRNYLIMKKNNK